VRGVTSIRGVTREYRRHRFAILFYSLLLTVGVAPFLHVFGFDFLEGFLALNLFAAALSATGRTGQGMIVLAVLFGGARLGGAIFGTQALVSMSEVVWIVVGLLATFGSLRRALRRGPVNAEQLYAALSVYVLIGLIFGMVYTLYERIWPGSFAAASGEGAFPFSRAVYFSFVTLASLGYGDILPVNDAMRGMAILEVIGGQLYLVVLVARLVSQYSAQERQER
jgi:hypothetical protein